MRLRTPNGTIDVRAIQKRAAEQIPHFVVSNEIALAVGLLATVTDELESRIKQLEELRETMNYAEQLRRGPRDAEEDHSRDQEGS